MPLALQSDGGGGAALWERIPPICREPWISDPRYPGLFFFCADFERLSLPAARNQSVHFRLWPLGHRAWREDYEQESSQSSADSGSKK